MDKPEDYSEETVDAINTLVDSASSPTTVSTGSEPNIICVLLESFCDPYEVNFLNMSEDPIPNFHNLEANYSTGYLYRTGRGCRYRQYGVRGSDRNEHAVFRYR